MVCKWGQTRPDFCTCVYLESGALRRESRTGRYMSASGSIRICRRGFNRSCIVFDHTHVPGLMSNMSQPMC